MLFGAGHKLFFGAIMKTVHSIATATLSGNANNKRNHQKADKSDASNNYKDIIHSKTRPVLEVWLHCSIDYRKSQCLGFDNHLDAVSFLVGVVGVDGSLNVRIGFELGDFGWGKPASFDGFFGVGGVGFAFPMLAEKDESEGLGVAVGIVINASGATFGGKKFEIGSLCGDANFFFELMQGGREETIAEFGVAAREIPVIKMSSVD